MVEEGIDDGTMRHPNGLTNSVARRLHNLEPAMNACLYAAICSRALTVFTAENRIASRIRTA